MVGSLCLLLLALGIVLWHDRDFWFPDTPEAESDQPVETSPAAKNRAGSSRNISRRISHHGQIKVKIETSTEAAVVAAATAPAPSDSAPSGNGHGHADGIAPAGSRSSRRRYASHHTPRQQFRACGLATRHTAATSRRSRTPAIPKLLRK